MARAINVTVTTFENESIDSLLRRFKTKTKAANVMSEARKRLHYSKPSESRREKHNRFLTSQAKKARRRAEARNNDK